MKTARCLAVMGLATFLSLAYVFQQTEAVKLGYLITARERKLEAKFSRS